MGTIRFTTNPDGNDVGLYDHEGYGGRVFDGGTLHSGGLVVEVDRRTVAFQAACECGWRGATVIDRHPDESAWLDFDDLPKLDAEWTAHTDPLLRALSRPDAAADIHGVCQAIRAVSAKVYHDLEPDHPDLAKVVLTRLADASAHPTTALGLLKAEGSGR